MKCLFILLLCSLLELSTGRPQAVTEENYRDAEETEYENDEEPAPEESQSEDEDAAIDEKVANKDEDDAVQPRHSRNFWFRQRSEGRTVADDRVTKGTNENFSEIKSDRRPESREDEAAENDDEQAEPKSRRDKYTDTNIGNSQFMQESDEQRENDGLSNQQLNKRKGSAAQEESNDMVYSDTKQEQADKVDKNKLNQDTAESIGQSRFYNHYYNRPSPGNRESQNNPNEEFNNNEFGRDRRNADDPTDDGTNQETKDKKDLENTDNEGEQAIIQKYVKKLNKKEVQELMSTLSEDKRKLLQQIIDNDGTNQAINFSKREITKKAGAVEENNFMDGLQSDSNKISDSFMNLNECEAMSPNKDASGMTTTADAVRSSTKVDENKVIKRSTSENEENVSEKLEIRTITPVSTEALTTKSDNKREVNMNDFNNENSQDASMPGLHNEFYAGSQDEDLTQLMNDDEQLNYEYRNPQKRDLTPETNAEMAEPMNSLQESFSNSNAYDDSGYYGGSNMAPLVRVKRRNQAHAVKKRDAAILPESKVAYVPENEDDDSDEGNEFYDDGFFDRTANFAKSNSRDKLNDSRGRHFKLNAENNQSEFKQSNAHVNDVSSDTMSIGSDTDNVLSGVEGANENLMYNGGSRMKRAVVKCVKLEPAQLVKADMFASPPGLSLSEGNGRPDIFGTSHNSTVPDYADFSYPAAPNKKQSSTE